MTPPQAIILIVAAALASCSVAPTMVRYPDGRIVVSSGFSLFEKTTNESAAVVLPDGTQFAYSKEGKDQTNVANMAIGTWGTVAGIKEMAAGLNDGEAIREVNQTRRAVSGDSVQKAGIAADVTKATFVPPQP